MKLAALPSVAHASNAGRYVCVYVLLITHNNDRVMCIIIPLHGIVTSTKS